MPCQPAYCFTIGLFEALHDLFGNFRVWFLEEEFCLSACFVILFSPMEFNQFFYFFFEEGCGKREPGFRAGGSLKCSFFGLLVCFFISLDATGRFYPS